MTTILDWAVGNGHVAIQVANGGYIVHATVNDPEDPSTRIFTTSVFASLDTMMGYVQRVVKDLEGPGTLVSGERLGGVAVP